MAGKREERIAVCSRRLLRREICAPEQPLKGFARGDRSAIHLGENLIDGVQSAGQLQIGEHLADMVTSNCVHRAASA
jgi:hypothetical protein